VETNRGLKCLQDRATVPADSVREWFKIPVRGILYIACSLGFRYLTMDRGAFQQRPDHQSSTIGVLNSDSPSIRFHGSGKEPFRLIVHVWPDRDLLRADPLCGAPEEIIANIDAPALQDFLCPPAALLLESIFPKKQKLQIRADAAEQIFVGIPLRSPDTVVRWRRITKVRSLGASLRRQSK